MIAEPPADDWLLPILGELLSSDNVNKTAEAVVHGESLWSTAIRLNLVSDAELLAAISRRTHVGVATSLDVTPEARELLPERIARK